MTHDDALLTAEYDNPVPCPPHQKSVPETVSTIRIIHISSSVFLRCISLPLLRWSDRVVGHGYGRSQY